MKHLRSVFVIGDDGRRLRRVPLTPVWRAIRLQLMSYRNPGLVDALIGWGARR